MEDLPSYFIKLLTIFIGSGFASLFAYWFGKQVIDIPGMIFEHETKNLYDYKMHIIKSEQISSRAGIYEIYLPTHEKVRLFLSHKGIKKL